MCDHCRAIESRIAQHRKWGGSTISYGGKLARVIGTRTLRRSGMPVVRLVDVQTGCEFVMAYKAFEFARFSGVA